MGAFLSEYKEVRDFYVPARRALTEQILLGGAPHAVAIVNVTLARAPSALDFASGSQAS